MSYELAKRVFDVAVAASGIAVSWPVVGGAALAVKLTSPGPVLYRSRRLGKDGQAFDLLKLRTMAVRQDPNAPEVTAGNDSRITPVGRLLRRTKVDELPQLWNVLVGEVSVVGPRPEAERYIRYYPSEYDEILSVRPGLTDRATLEYVDEETLLANVEDPERYYIETLMPKKMAMYLEYVRAPSLAADVQIVARTLLTVLERLWETLKQKRSG